MKRLGVAERYVDLRGSLEARNKAKAKIMEIADFVKDADGFIVKGDAEEGRIMLRISRDEVGNILGRHGDTIRDMEHDTRTRIDVCRKTGKVRIEGSAEARAKAQEKILEEVTYCENECGKVIKDGKEEKDDSLRLYVLDSEAGRVIGRGGETVKEIMDQSKSQVKVQKNESQDAISNERLIQIYGDDESKARAKELILEEVTFAKDHIGDIIKNTGNHNIEPGLAHLRAVSKGCWICGFCSGDHKTKECPSREMNAQAMMQMQMLAGMTPMVPGMPIVPVVPVSGFPGMPYGINGPMLSVDQREVDEVDAALREYEREDEEEDEEEEVVPKPPRKPRDPKARDKDRRKDKEEEKEQKKRKRIKEEYVVVKKKKRKVVPPPKKKKKEVKEKKKNPPPPVKRKPKIEPKEEPTSSSSEDVEESADIDNDDL